MRDRKEDVRFRTKDMEKKIKAVCNICVLLVLAGMGMVAMANNSQDVMNAFTLMGIGAAGGIVFGHILEKLEQQSYRKVLEEDKEYARQVEYWKHPLYSFVTFLNDNGCTLQELIEMIDEAPNPRHTFDTVYLNYKVAAKEDRIESKEQVQSMIWRERRRMGHEAAKETNEESETDYQEPQAECR